MTTDANNNNKIKRTDLHHFNPLDLTIIGHDTDHKSVVDHPQWDPRSSLPVDESMVLNVLELGIIQPVRCITTGKGETLKRLVIAGRQRVKAARIANERLAQAGSELRITVPVMFEQGSDEGRTFSVRISENEIRKDDSVLIKAKNAVDMANRFGKNQAEIAVVFGVSKQTISQWFKLNALMPEIKEAVAHGKITSSAALAFSDVPKEEQAQKLKEVLETKPKLQLVGDPSEESVGDLTFNPNARGEFAAVPAPTAPAQTNEAPKKPAKKTEADVKATLSGKQTLPKPSVKEIRDILEDSKVSLSDEVRHILQLVSGDLEPKGSSNFEKALKALRKAGK